MFSSFSNSVCSNRFEGPCKFSDICQYFPFMKWSRRIKLIIWKEHKKQNKKFKWNGFLFFTISRLRMDENVFRIDFLFFCFSFSRNHHVCALCTCIKLVSTGECIPSPPYPPATAAEYNNKFNNRSFSRSVNFLFSQFKLFSCHFHGLFACMRLQNEIIHVSPLIDLIFIFSCMDFFPFRWIENCSPCRAEVVVNYLEKLAECNFLVVLAQQHENLHRASI